jgi:hypothetical protein
MKAISIPEKKAQKNKHSIIILISISYGYLLALLSNFLANFLLKKNIKIATAAIIKLSHGDSEVPILVKPTYINKMPKTK